MYQGENFKIFLNQRNIAITKAAKMLKVSRQTVYQYFVTGNLGRETVNNILTIFDVKEIEIWPIGESKSPIGENEPLYLSEPSTEYQSNPRLEAKPTRLYADPMDYEDKKQRVIVLPDGTMAMKVPIVPARAYAGYMRGFADPEYYDDLEDIMIGVDKEPHGTYIGFEVVGDSMICLDTVELAEESIFPGRIAIGRDLPQENWKTRLHTHNYKNWIFVHKTEGILIKQIASHNIEEGKITVHSLNPKYADEEFKLDDMQQIFSVMQIVQKTRPKPR